MADTPNSEDQQKDPWAHEKGLSQAPENASSRSERGIDQESAEDRSAEPAAKKKVPPPENLFQFVRHFYVTKTVVSDQYKEFFKELDGNISSEEMNELSRMAAETDTEFGRTLSLAEFVLESAARPNQRDQLMNFVQSVASNAGSLGSTESNAVFQSWLVGNSALSNKLQFFFGQIERITDGKDKKGRLKKLSEKKKNNLGSIAAMWLYYKGETSIAQLIEHLLHAGMNLKGQAGHQVDDRAFAFAASMIKSTNKKKFAYFLDHVKRNEDVLNRQYLAESAKAGDLARRFAQQSEELETSQRESNAVSQEVQRMEGELKSLRAEKTSLQEQLQHTSIHHGAEKDSERSNFESVLKDLLKTIELAQKAAEEGHGKALTHQLKHMEKAIRREMK